MAVYDVPRGLTAMWCAGDAPGVDRERLEGPEMGVREGWPIGRFACLPRYYGRVASCMGAGRVQGERTHRTGPADTKNPTLIRFPGPWKLTGDFYAPSAACNSRRVGNNIINKAALP